MGGLVARGPTINNCGPTAQRKNERTTMISAILQNGRYHIIIGRVVLIVVLALVLIVGEGEGLCDLRTCCAGDLSSDL